MRSTALFNTFFANQSIGGLNFRKYNKTGVVGWKRSDGHSAEKSAGAAAWRGTSRDGRGRTSTHAAEGTTRNDGEAAMALGVQSDHHAAKRT